MVFTSCQQKETPKSQEQAPVGIIHSGEEIRLLQEAVEKEPGNGDAWIKLANNLMDSSRFDEAIEAYQKALSTRRTLRQGLISAAVTGRQVSLTGLSKNIEQLSS